MSAKTFVDTNILIYAYDVDAGAKHSRANEALSELWQQRTGVLSLQVLQEFYVNVTRKISSPLSKALARSIVNDYIPWCTETTTTEISAAFRHEDEHQIGFWDALIIATAAKSGASKIFSEDLNSGQYYSGVLVENPFVRLQHSQ